MGGTGRGHLGSLSGTLGGVQARGRRADQALVARHSVCGETSKWGVQTPDMSKFTPVTFPPLLDPELPLNSTIFP